MPFPETNLEDFSYNLPEDRIAQYPLAERDSSRLLCSVNGTVSEDNFRNLAGHIPKGSMMVFNNTRVIRARLIFQKETGTHIEIFCLEPLKPAREVNLAFQQLGPVAWKCLIGNAKRWRSGTLTKQVEISGRSVTLYAERGEELEDGTFSIMFSWDHQGITFGRLLEDAGRIPLPPYISRDDNPSDSFRYQTIYALMDGSVAAPTAGLHFTPAVLESLISLGIQREEVTLHVGLGTFRPVTVPDLRQHVMHEEKIIVKAETIRHLSDHFPNPVIAVGTTSVRTLESLYWMGVKQLTNPDRGQLDLGQWEPYNLAADPQVPSDTALRALLRMLDQRGLSELTATTKLLIVPGYRFHIVRGMVTNFHQPRSTLLMLIAAFLGDSWKEAYSYALAEGFRFLSYGDSCLFIHEQPE